MPPRADLIGFIVSDMRVAMEFYGRLGLEFHLGSDTDDHAEATLPGGLRFALDTEASVLGFDPSWTARSGGRRASLAFLCESPAEVDRLYAEVTAAGYEGHLPPFAAPPSRPSR